MATRTLLLLGLVAMAAACRQPEAWTENEWDERLSGGNQTVFVEGVDAFSAMFPNLNANKAALHEIGDMHFEATFVPAPAAIFLGLGPIYNNNSCFNCHVNDGRGKPIEANEPTKSMLIRISTSGKSENGGPNPMPGYGGQLQDKAVFGNLPEATVSVVWHSKKMQLADGEEIELRYPEWILENPYLPFNGEVLLSARIAPPIHGLGLLELVSEVDILSFADEYDADNDGISGKPNYVYSPKIDALQLGRFGWKCEAPTIEHQIAGAYNDDMGITTSFFPRESSFGQEQDDKVFDDPEVSDSIFNAVVFYVQSLAVPARRNVQSEGVLNGQKLFAKIGCASCHIPTLTTGTFVPFREASNQLIHPYTDLLLHNMGEELSDNRATFSAEGNDWRTPPLWGIGLTKAVNGHTYFLHDGRARNLEEAILWHGGEAEKSQKEYMNLSKFERTELVQFLNSL